MTELKCPICNSNLIITRLCDGIFPNPNKGKIDEIFCDECKMHGTEELWQALIDTKKKLDIAVEELTKIKVAAESVGIGFFMTAAISALAKIKNVEQIKDNDKDVK